MLKPIQIKKERVEALKETFIREAMKEVKGLTYGQAEAAFNLIHKSRAVWPEFREQPTPSTMSALAQKALDGVAEMKRVLGGGR